MMPPIIPQANFCGASKMPRRLRQNLQSHQRIDLQGMDMDLLTDLKCDALTGRLNQ
jgi:hypothetical protein